MNEAEHRLTQQALARLAAENARLKRQYKAMWDWNLHLQAEEAMLRVRIKQLTKRIEKVEFSPN